MCEVDRLRARERQAGVTWAAYARHVSVTRKARERCPIGTMMRAERLSGHAEC